MTKPSTTGRQRRLTAVAYAASALVIALGGMNAVYAQSNTTGNVYGTVKAEPGVVVVVEGASGQRRTLTPDANGRFSATALPTGTYKATLVKNGATVATSAPFEVLIGQGSEIVFPGSGAQVVEITGRLLRLDMSSSSGGATFTAKQLDSIPSARNLDAIIQLAPNTTRADPRYSGGASIGGGAPSENSYYINGFPVTNPLNQLGSSELPFGAIAQAQVLTGGFGAEFGRSTGGVLNVTTKSGTNSWEAGVNASITPSSLRSKYKDLTYANTGASTNTTTDGTLYQRNSDRKTTETSLGAYIGGPLVQDRLFMFVAVERNTFDTERMSTPVTSFTNGFSNGGWAERDNTNDRYLAKFDFAITKDHLLEATLIGDTYKQEERLYGYNYLTGQRDGNLKQTATFENNTNAVGNLGVGAEAQILKYTGYLTNDLTLTVLGGQSSSKHKSSYAGYDVYSDLRQVVATAANRYPGFTYAIPYAFAGNTLVAAPGSEDKVKAFRADLEYQLGSHLLRAGVDTVKLESINAGDLTAGGGTITYLRTTSKTTRPNGINAPVASAPGVLTQPGPGAPGAADDTYYYYGQEQIFSTVTNAESNQSAFYLEDGWQITKDFKFTPGLRIEKYENLNGDGETFLKVNTQIHPRFAFTWDLLGDKSTKLFGSAGRYGVQIPTHLAVRGASRSTFTRQTFIYSGVDPVTGAPTGRVDLGAPFSSNNEYGQAKDAKTVAAQDLKPNSQDELRLGIERALTDKLNVGATMTYRKLVATIDDLCDPRPFDNYAAQHGIDTTNYAGFGCASFNPGQSNTFLVNYAGDGVNYTTVNLSKEELGFEKAKRTYLALDFFAEHPFSDGWYGKVTYTYSRSKGNTEGQTLSDVAQTDVAATQTWDHPELMVGANGFLPNDRRHQIKAYGFVRVVPEVDVGAAFLAASGRPKNCIGNYGGTPSFGQTLEEFYDTYSYGSAYRYCSFDGGQTFTYTPRGSEGYLPWDIRLDMNVVYSPEWAKGLKFSVDVFNVTNRQTEQAISEVHEANYDPATVLPTYGRVISYTPPRAVKLGIKYEMKF